MEFNVKNEGFSLECKSLDRHVKIKLKLLYISMYIDPLVLQLVILTLCLLLLSSPIIFNGVPLFLFDLDKICLDYVCPTLKYSSFTLIYHMKSLEKFRYIL